MNRLSHETSPYLLQHAHNPVDWYPWGEEAFAKAQKEDKPILLSIGYSTCHWCHVMERESFEDPRVAQFMNEYFVNIKVDREERPDVDSIYMEVIQAISGSGGWPLNCFLLPDKRAFFAGTYFPPQPAHGRSSWMQVLNNIRTAYYTRRSEVEQQATTLIEVLKKSDTHFVSTLALADEETVFTKEILENTFYALRERFDSINGGFGSAPKFPSMPALRFCLQYHHFLKNDEAIQHLNRSLHAMIQGGIYDQLGGGFARYAVDDAWLVPHFEKMLYDNALLLRLLSDAYAHTKIALYGETIAETINWIEREMSSPEGGFFSAMDADSEGVEGKYYVWSKAETDALLGKDAALFNAFYDVTEHGNWEETNILHRDLSYEAFAEQQGLDLQQLKDTLRQCRKTLLTERQKRVAPGIDEKVLLDWNGLLISGLCKAHRSTGNNAYKDRAVKAVQFIRTKMVDPQTKQLFHSYKDGKAKHAGFLDDYAAWIEALIQVYFSTFEDSYLVEAEFYLKYVMAEFWDAKDQLFFFTSKSASQDLIHHKKELYDNATPSGNALMIHNLQRLGALLDNWEYREQAQRTLKVMLASIQKYPLAFAHWGNALFWECCPTHEIAIVGKNYLAVLEGLNNRFFPNAIVAASAKPEASNVRFLEGRTGGDETWIYVCQQGACQLPVQSIDAMFEQLEH